MTTPIHVSSGSLPAISGYSIIEQLYQGARTTIYRAVQTSLQRPVVLKALRESPSFGELVRFRNQYAIAKNLPIAGIVRPLSLEPLGDRYMLVMEDFGGVSLIDYLKQTGEQRKLDLPDVLAIAIQLAQILHELSQHRVIHKDIKPANLLIHPQSKQIKLIDFSIASLLPRETQEILNPNVLEGTLAYLAPEQTGRMNRGIDYRADFYALGVTLYQLLSGKLPFESSDPLELVHCHIAKVPPPVHHVKGDVPASVSAIVAKLMAKNAEDRYQTALGLRHDLEVCLTQWEHNGAIADLVLGLQDVGDRFTIPEKLYGREAEVQTLLEAFERVADGSAELMLVAGFSGIGKTAVVNEVHKPIVQQRGYFIKGKYDQLNRNIPFSGLVQALRDLMGQLLSESALQLKQWQHQIMAALGENGQVLIEVIPELEQVIGQQPPAPELSGSATQNRFNLLFQKFIALFATRKHPLVIFLDDLQWADAASLNLMQMLMEQQDYLLLIGAYRDNEVFPAHPLMMTLQEIETAKVPVSKVTLAPLKQTDIHRLIADTLNCAVAIVLPLSYLVYQKTQGNPFFTTQFLKALHEEGCILFDPQTAHWQCDIAAVKARATTDDIVEFMTLQLQKLPDVTQELLKLAACIGAQFDLETLAVVSQQTIAQVAIDLWTALKEGLILPISEVYKFYQPGEETEAPTSNPFNCSYRFLHDRVQQAAYSLIPEEHKQTTHFKIGQLLLQQSSSRKENRIFEIVNQLNYGIDFITEQCDRNELIRLNLLAGHEAKAATAYQAATEYATFGIRLLNSDRWQTQYQTALELHNLGAEAAYLAGDFAFMSELIQVVLDRVHDPLDQVKVYEVQIQACSAQNRAREAIQLGRKSLKLFGIEFPENISASDVQSAIQEVRSLLVDQQRIEDLLHLPLMTDKIALAAMRILSNIITPAYHVDPDLFPLLPLMQVRLSVQYGNSSHSAFGYLGYGIILCGLVEDIESGYRFGRLAINLLNQIDAKEVTSKVVETFDCHLRHWKEHTQETVPSLLDAYTIGLGLGDLEFAAFSIYYHNDHRYFLGENLHTLAQEMGTCTQVLQQIKQERMMYSSKIQHQRVLNLLGEAEDVLHLKGDTYDESVMLSISLEKSDLVGLLKFSFTKLQLSYLFGKYELAQEYANLVEQYASGGLTMVISRQCNFYISLARLSVFSEVDLTAQAEILKQVSANQEKMQQWAQHCPMNVLHQHALIEAERHRVLGNKAEAIDYYDRAIADAKKNGYLPEEALANELAAKFYLAWGKEKFAASYMQEAYCCYAQWGAKAKTDDLKNQYPDLLHSVLQPVVQPLDVLESLARVAETDTSFPTGIQPNYFPIPDINRALDLTAILKASQSLSSTIHLNELLHQLTQIILQNSGGDRCTLIQPNSMGEWQVKAIAVPETTELCAAPLESQVDLPIKLIQYVKNTQAVVVINNLMTDLPVFDPYLTQKQPKSLLCSPILNQGNLIGILSLENQSVSNVFTRDRILVLNFLCTQAAIALENARLYQQAQTYAQELEQSLHSLQSSQAALQQSESTNHALMTQLQSVTNNLPGVVYQFKVDAQRQGSFSYMSNRCQDLFEVEASVAQQQADAINRQVDPLDLEAFRTVAINSMQSLQPFTWIGRFNLPSGKQKWIEARSLPQRQADGSTVWDGVMLDVSERKQAELALQEKEGRLQRLTANIAGVVYQFALRADGSEGFTYISPKCRNIFELELEELKQDFGRVWTMHHPDDVERVQQQTLYAAQHLEPFDEEFRIICPSGQMKWVRVMAHPERQPNGDVLFDGLVVNITDRKQAEEALRESEDQLRLAISSARIGTWDWNVVTEELKWNDQCKDIMNLPLEEEPSLEFFFNSVHPEDLDYVRGVMQATFDPASGGFYDIEFRLNQTQRWVAAKGKAYYDANGKPFRFIGTALDITAQKQAEQGLRTARDELERQVQKRTKELREANGLLEQREREFRTLVENTPDIVARHDYQYRNIYSNPACTDVLGVAPGLCLGKTPSESGYPQEIAEFWETSLERALTSGEIQIDEFTITNSDPPRIYQVYVVPERESNHAIASALTIGREITQLRQAEEAARKLAEELQRSNEELEQFAYIASHDLQEPLRAITSFSQILAARYQHQLDAKADTFIGFIVDGATRMQQLIRDLLAYSRVGRYELKLQPVDCNLMLERVKQDLHVAIAENRATITSDPLPSITADPNQVAILLQNLIENALKYRSDADPQIHLSATVIAAEVKDTANQTSSCLGTPKRKWLCSVQDNGIGIEPDYFERIFGIFQRLHTSDEYPGTGLGLAICRKIVERHNGHIWVESHLGQGTTFFFTVPISVEVQNDNSG